MPPQANQAWLLGGALRRRLFLGSSTDHYCAFRCFIKQTRARRVCNTIQFLHRHLTQPAFTATDDREGDPEAVEVETPPTALDLERALAERFTGEFLQTPPAFSAKKVDGRRAYRTARQGGDPKLEPRPVRVHEIRLESYDWPIATISIACDKGFYVRSLARELGNVLGTGGHCASIRRTAVGPFTLDDAIALDDLPDPLPADHLVPLPTAMTRLEADQADASG